MAVARVTGEVLLALESSTSVGSVAVGDGGRGTVEVSMGVDARHSESLLVAVDFALRAAGRDVSELTGIVVGSGPGSFTGVRVAGATAKGLVHALGIPLYAVSGLEALAAGVAASGRPAVALLDARQDRVYAACYAPGAEGRLETLLPPVASTVHGVLSEFEGRRRLRAVYVGDGALRHRARIVGAGGAVIPGPWHDPRASALLWLRSLDPASRLVADPGAWEPEYIREWGPTAH